MKDKTKIAVIDDLDTIIKMRKEFGKTLIGNSVKKAIICLYVWMALFLCFTFYFIIFNTNGSLVIDIITIACASLCLIALFLAMVASIIFENMVMNYMINKK